LAIVYALMAAVVAVVSYPVVTLVAMTASVGLFAAVRVVATRVEHTTMKVGIPGLPVEVTVTRTATE
jgi:hypothetical protein